MVSTPSPDRLFGSFWSPDDGEMKDTSRAMLVDLPLDWGRGGPSVRFMIAPDDLAAGRIEEAEAKMMW